MTWFYSLKGLSADANCPLTLGDAKSETTVGTWICNRETVLGPRIIASSLVVLVFRAEDRHFRNFASRLEVYFNKRHSELVFDAMVEQPLYIYIALYQCFNSFTTFFHQYQGIYEEVVSFPIIDTCTKRLVLKLLINCPTVSSSREENY